MRDCFNFGEQLEPVCGRREHLCRALLGDYSIWFVDVRSQVSGKDTRADDPPAACAA
jgi:hypothetical protein